ncbi:hypothetical protein, partial [Acrocarpospora sp. B8E8]|uniref:hypothetical protein n=1 Tax=Acrocarpospora sp. B8E8 TaxID=3153572 RepID=UPI00325EEE9A
MPPDADAGREHIAPARRSGQKPQKPQRLVRKQDLSWAGGSVRRRDVMPPVQAGAVGQRVGVTGRWFSSG